MMNSNRPLSALHELSPDTNTYCSAPPVLHGDTEHTVSEINAANFPNSTVAVKRARSYGSVMDEEVWESQQQQQQQDQTSSQSQQLPRVSSAPSGAPAVEASRCPAISRTLSRLAPTKSRPRIRSIRPTKSLCTLNSTTVSLEEHLLEGTAPPGKFQLSETLTKLVLCFCGLQMSYLTWAYLQEFIMTTRFNPTPLNPSGRFPSASFCVVLNRCVALSVALVAVKVHHGAFFSNSKAPVTVFMPCAISNTLSSISQYASLQYVSFPLMTVFKSSTIIPVMLMGYWIKGTTYSMGRYMEAMIITMGVAVFSFHSQPANAAENTSYGMLLLVAYVIFDSFTTVWQDKVYSLYGRENVDPYQMMLGVDSTAILLTTASLVLSGELPAVFEFFDANPHVLVYNLLCPVASTCGQLCIFWTIKEFGPVVFTIIMTTRKLFSICISSVVFGHVIDPHAALGGGMVLGAIFSGVHRSYQQHNSNNKHSNSNNNLDHMKRPPSPNSGNSNGSMKKEEDSSDSDTSPV